MKIVKFRFNMFGENCYVVWSTDTKECMIVDPGMLNTAENEAIDGFIASEGLTVKYLVNTHLHLDHCFGNNHVAEKYCVTTHAHPADHALGRDIRNQAAAFGIKDSSVTDIDKFEPLTDGTVLTLGKEEIRVIHVPGHSEGGIALYAPADRWVISGDSLFKGSIGRTDLPGGDHSKLVKAVTDKLLTLPDATMVLPGHGPVTSISEEKRTNPYL